MFTILKSNETVIIPKIVILKSRILYDLDRQPSKNQKFTKETVNSSSYEKFKKILKRLFLESFQTALFRATTKSLGLRLL